MSDIEPSLRADVTEARRVVVKLGTRVVTQEGEGVALSRLSGVVEEVARAVRAGREVLIVSSGAVGLGRQALDIARTPTDLIERQVCAAVGQSRLMELYQMLFSRLGLVTAQVLLTESDFQNRGRYLNLRGTLSRLLARGIVPIINENDVVSTEELALDPAVSTAHAFGDNDMLSALVASKLDAQLLVLLTDVPGVYEADPVAHPGARLVATVARADDLMAELSGSTSGVGRGGMRNKVAAAALAARAGCHAVIASGLVPGQLTALFDGQEVGTWFTPTGHLTARQRWIAFAATPSGVLHLDAGAVAALVERHASLLPAGVVTADGAFRRGDVVELQDPARRTIGRGIVETDADQTRAWMRGQAPKGVRTLIRGERLVITAPGVGALPEETP
jgi:glutamate 5-kinase